MVTCKRLCAARNGLRQTRETEYGLCVNRITMMTGVCRARMPFLTVKLAAACMRACIMASKRKGKGKQAEEVPVHRRVHKWITQVDAISFPRARKKTARALVACHPLFTLSNRIAAVHHRLMQPWCRWASMIRLQERIPRETLPHKG